MKLGKSMWDWRVAKYEAPDGFVYGLNTTSHKRFIDFASENGVEYLLMDADWYGPEFSKDSDPTKAQGDIDVRENFAYAKEKGVGLILYLNDIGAKKFGLERVLKQFRDWGASGVKYGFMTGKGREKVLYTRHVTELCAKYKLMVNFHDIPIPPSGDDRTYPNLVTREFCHSQADAHRSYFPETAVSACFVNQIVGPLDECNCRYDLNNAHSRTKVFQPIPGTVAAENAKLVVYYSPLTVLLDAPEAYLAKKDLFEFVKQLPNTFDDMVVMNDVIGESVTIARKKDDSWYVGSLTNRDGRTLDIPLTFLNEGEYVATIYRDADDAHYLENKEAYAVETKTVTKDDVIKAKLAPGGGHSMVLVKKR